MEKRIELEKRGRTPDQVDDFHPNMTGEKRRLLNVAFTPIGEKTTAVAAHSTCCRCFHRSHSISIQLLENQCILIDVRRSLTTC